MLSSMTGFAEVSTESEGIVYTVEIKTVNNRYLKTSLRLSDSVSFCEEEVEKRIRGSLHRGMINYWLHLHNISGPALYDVDTVVINKYIKTLRDVAAENSLEYQINLADLLTLPGAVQPALPDPEQAEKMKQVILELTDKALEKLRRMRLCEGQALENDLLMHCEAIRDRVERIRERMPAVVEEYHERLSRRTEELLKEAKLKMDESLLAREVALFAERCDIAEELARLDSHIEQFRNACKKGDNVGRKLDFISQEMLREANTIASKAGDSGVCGMVIEIKCAIDRIKEQVQNIE